MSEIKSPTIPVDKLEFITHLKQSEVLTQLQSSSTKYLLVTVSGVNFDITFQRAFNKIVSVRVEGSVEGFDHGSKIKIQLLGGEFKGLSKERFFMRICILCLLYLFVYSITKSNWVFFYLIVSLLMFPFSEKISRKYQATISGEQRKLLLQFLKEKFPDITPGI